MGKFVLFLCIGVFVAGGVSGYFLHDAIAPGARIAAMKLLPGSGAGRPVATVGGQEITREALDLRWEKVLSPQVRTEFSRRGGRREYLDEMIDETLLALEAAARGLDRDPVSLEKIRIEGTHLITRPLIQEEVVDKAFSEEALRAEFEARKEEFRQRATARVRHILATPIPYKAGDVRNESGDDAKTPEEAKAKIERILRDLQGGASFEDLARKESECPSAPQGGDLGTFGRGTMVPVFEEAAFATPVGQISGILETEFGWHILRVEEREEEKEPAFEDARARLASEMLRKDPRAAEARYKEFLGELRSKYGVVVDDAALR